MEKDKIVEIGINKKEQLYIKPETIAFPFVYREAVEVHWNEEKKYLYSPKPREWSYANWYEHIIGTAKIQSCELYITENTIWTNIPEDLKYEIKAL